MAKSPVDRGSGLQGDLLRGCLSPHLWQDEGLEQVAERVVVRQRKSPNARR